MSLLEYAAFCFRTFSSMSIEGIVPYYHFYKSRSQIDAEPITSPNIAVIKKKIK